MKILQLSYSDSGGGAARAAFRIHKAINAQSKDSSIMYVSKKYTCDSTVSVIQSSNNRISNFFRYYVWIILSKIFSNNSIKSFGLFSSRIPKIINKSNFDVINLHWIGAEFLSIADIGKIRKPIVWTLHDMWPFCGGEHYAFEDERWRNGYFTEGLGSSFFDFDAITWLRKKIYWKKSKFNIVAPSNWMAKCVAESKLMTGWNTHVIPYPIDTEKWSPIEYKVARNILGIPHDIKLLAFGAMDNLHDKRKGFDLLLNSLRILKEKSDIEKFALLVFGNNLSDDIKNTGFDIYYFDNVSDDVTLRVIYSAADAYALPSRQDNLPLMGIEAKSVGAPLVGFNNSGIPDLICHKVDGYLARNLDCEDYASGITWALEHGRSQCLRNAIRQDTVLKHSFNVVGDLYRNLYRKVKT